MVDASGTGGTRTEADPISVLVGRLGGVVGAAHVLADRDTFASYETDWTRRFTGPAALVVRPGSSAEVAAVIDACRDAGLAVVVQGGNTGLVGGSVPPPAGDGPAPVLISTTRLDDLSQVDRMAAQITAGAGVTLGRLQAAAEAAGFTFPVDLAARDSATVGGMIATNAGGLHVMRFGSMRSQVVGLEVVLPDGSIVSRLSGLVKDNTGYDLAQLMTGAEGTLGVVTAARLRLVPAHPARVVALIGQAGIDQALAVVDHLRRRVESLQAAEVFFDDGLELVMEHSRLGRPLPRSWPAYLLVECAAVSDPGDLLYQALGDLDLADDGTAVAADRTGCERLWAYRELHTEAVSALGVPHKLDVTLPQSRLAEFEVAVRELVADRFPGSRLVIFGHIGDGNLHVNVVGPAPDDEALDRAVLELVADMAGSVSAEHGIGRAKTAWLHLSRSQAEIDAMRAVKRALDPDGILNPGVLLPSAGP